MSLNDADELLSVRAAELYYDENLTQDEIGGKLHLTRWKVGRLLAQARQQGIVRIEIVHPRARRVLAERALQERYGLKGAVVVSSAGVADDAELQRRVAQAAADFLTAMRPAPPTLGVSWGRTMHDVAASLPVGWARGVGVVQINGGLSLTPGGGNAAATAISIAQKAFGSAHVLPIPAILEHAETKRSIERDRAVGSVLDRASKASAYLFSAGVPSDDSALVHSGYLTPDDVAVLVGKGAVGDVVGRFIGADGRPVDAELDSRTVGLGLDAIRSAETAIAVVAGEGKHDVARALAVNGLCTIMITDDRTAGALLEGDGRPRAESSRAGANAGVRTAKAEAMA
jgi:Transcriptional regulator, contains sigma factor-related N-terminal domain